MHHIADGLLGLAKDELYWSARWELDPGTAQIIEKPDSSPLTIENRTQTAALSVFLQTSDSENYFIQLDGKHVLLEHEAESLEQEMEQFDSDPATLIEQLNLADLLKEKDLDLESEEDLSKIRSLVLKVLHVLALYCTAQQYAGSLHFRLYAEGEHLTLREEDDANYCTARLEPVGAWAHEEAYVLMPVDSGELEKTN